MWSVARVASHSASGNGGQGVKSSIFRLYRVIRGSARRPGVQQAVRDLAAQHDAGGDVDVGHGVAAPLPQSERMAHIDVPARIVLRAVTSMWAMASRLPCRTRSKWLDIPS